MLTIEHIVKRRGMLLVLGLLLLSSETHGSATVVSKLVEPQSAHWDQNALKALLSTPLALFALMLLGSLGNGIKQLLVVKQTGKPMTCFTYFGYWPETLATFIGNALAFAVLISTDQLNLASALSVGYGINSVTDLLPGKRSFALKSTPNYDETEKQEEPKS